MITFDVIQKTDTVPTFIGTASISRQEFQLVYNALFEKINQLDDTVQIHVVIKLTKS